MWSIHIIPMSPEKEMEITGSDLAWKPHRSAKPTVSIRELVQATKAKAIKLPSLTNKSKDSDFRKAAVEINATRVATDNLERLITGHDPEPARITKLGDFEGFDLGNLGRFYRMQFELAMVEKDAKGALDRFLKLRQYSKFMLRRQGGIAYDPSGLYLYSMVQFAARRSVFSTNDLRAMYLAIGPSPKVDEALIWKLRYEYALFGVEPFRGASAKEIRKMLSDDLLVGELDVPATMSSVAGIVREAMRNSSLPSRLQTWPEVTALGKKLDALPDKPDIDEDTNFLKRWWLEAQYKQRLKSIPNALGLTFLHSFGADFAQMDVLSSFANRVRQDGTRLVLELTIYRKSFGSYPKSLADLRVLNLPGPEPFDFFAGGPFHYDVKRNIFWSVGENGKDERGVNATSGGGPEDDIVTRLY